MQLSFCVSLEYLDRKIDVVNLTYRLNEDYGQNCYIFINAYATLTML